MSLAGSSFRAASGPDLASSEVAGLRRSAPGCAEVVRLRIAESILHLASHSLHPLNSYCFSFFAVSNGIDVPRLRRRQFSPRRVPVASLWVELGKVIGLGERIGADWMRPVERRPENAPRLPLRPSSSSAWPRTPGARRCSSAAASTWLSNSAAARSIRSAPPPISGTAPACCPARRRAGFPLSSPLSYRFRS